jgi:hypothetical protein
VHLGLPWSSSLGSMRRVPDREYLYIGIVPIRRE